MSDTGLNANIYYLTSKYLGLLNDFMIAIKNDSEKVPAEKYKEVKELFEKLKDDESIDPRIQVLSVIIEAELRKKNFSKSKFFNGIAADINQKKYESLSKNLHHVVNALDSEYSHALAKMSKES
ncbi:hypothetical protein AWW67_12845 [Roseivirga seohaensis]|jgi:hypothetical protein|uniref:Uncharacterized protein n=1 Tax=Roseivirga seohaensis TaxID=1914963 RepID=A0A150XKP8_9BACT|nr:hypothetical protein [Roseivirga seohaensis]KYG79261.1 hypothetical protein AWW67_12845 [Roseivirga seohaensis]